MKLHASSRLRLRDVLVLRVEGWEKAKDGDDIHSSAMELVNNLSAVVGVTVIVIDAAMTLDSISESDMARAGWVKLNTVPPNGSGLDHSPRTSLTAASNSG